MEANEELINILTDNGKVAWVGTDLGIPKLLAWRNEAVVAANQDFAKFLAGNLRLPGVKPATLEEAVYQTLIAYFAYPAQRVENA